MDESLLDYYEAIERASHDMLMAARSGDWDAVIKLEGACALLIAQLKRISAQARLAPTEQQVKTRIMQRILLNDAEIRHLAEPWLEELGAALAGHSRLVH
ncbi:MAG: flagellar protein FliT [Proteobacteria bacterium]|nr:flagellar protein FliT [Methylibium sp.]MBY0366697.1 flagellar protein FliT [Burkholderiaceae bacterium]MCH8857153.1 flagellar protein FliT [Pseudomonadota bacterium]